MRYKPGLAVFLKRAQDLTDLLYAKDGAKLGTTVAVRIRASAPYTKIIFESAGRKLTYFNTKERWEDVVWPSSDTVFRTVQNANEAQLGYPEGEWALFHLLDDGKLAPASDGEEYLGGSWTPAAGGPVVHADLKPAAPPPPRLSRDRDPPWNRGWLLRMQMSDAGNVGLYGKVATQPDFFRVGAGAFSQAGLDRWLQEGAESLRAERTQLPTTPTAFLLAPAGAVAFVGTLTASVRRRQSLVSARAVP